MAAPPKAPSKPSQAPNPLLNPSQQLQGPGLQQAAQALTDAQTKGPLTELAKQIAFNNRQGAAAQAKSAGYFKSLGNVAHLGAVGEQGIGNQLNARLQGISNDTQNRLTQSGWQGLGGIVSHSPQGGDQTGENPAISGLASEIARQQGLAAQNAGAYRSAGALQGANYSGLAAQNQGTYALKGQEALTGMARATRLSNEPINQKIADLQASKGSLLASNEGKLRQQEISNQITRQGLSIKDQANQIAAQNNAANQQLTQEKINATIRGQDVSLTIGQANAKLRSISNRIAGGNLTERQRHDLVTEQQALNRSVGAHNANQLGVSGQNSLVGRVGKISGQLQGLIVNNGLSPSDAYHILQRGGYVKNASGHPVYVGPVGDIGLLNAAYNTRQGAAGLSPGDVQYLIHQGLPNPGARFPVSRGRGGVLGGSLFGLTV